MHPAVFKAFSYVTRGIVPPLTSPLLILTSLSQPSLTIIKASLSFMLSALSALSSTVALSSLVSISSSLPFLSSKIAVPLSLVIELGSYYGARRDNNKMNNDVGGATASQRHYESSGRRATVMLITVGKVRQQ